MKTRGWNVIKRSAFLGIALWAALAVARPALAKKVCSGPDDCPLVGASYGGDNEDYRRYRSGGDRQEITDPSVAVDSPVSSSISLKSGAGTSTYSDSSISGFTAAVSVGLLGLGYESYSSKFSKSGTSFNYTVEMYDIVLNLPIPVIDIAIGAGVGTGSFSNFNTPLGSLGNPFKRADLTQGFASLGIPIFSMVDLHVGYHSFSGTNNSKQAGLPNAKVDGNMTSVGIKIGF